jgi:hypothetical protein
MGPKAADAAIELASRELVDAKSPSIKPSEAWSGNALRPVITNREMNFLKNGTFRAIRHHF